MQRSNPLIMLMILLSAGAARAEARVDARLQIAADGGVQAQVALARPEVVRLLALDPDAPDAALHAALNERLAPALARSLRLSADPTPCLWQTATWEALDGDRFALRGAAACPPAPAYDLDWGGRATLHVEVSLGDARDTLTLAPGDAPARLIRRAAAPGGTPLLLPALAAAVAALLGFLGWRRRRRR